MAITTVSKKCPECGASLNIEKQREVSFCSYCGAKIIIHNKNDMAYRNINDSGADISPPETIRAEKMKLLELAKEQLAAAEKAKKIKEIKIIASWFLGLFAFCFLMYGLSAKVVAGYVISAICGFVLLLFWAKDIIGNKIIASVFLGIIAIIILIYGLIAKLVVCYVISAICGFVVLALIMDSLDSDNNTPDKNTVEYGRICIVPSGINNYMNKSYVVIENILTEAGFLDVRCIPLHDLKIGFFNKPNTVESITIDGEQIEKGGGKYPSYASIVISYHSYYKKET